MYLGSALTIEARENKVEYKKCFFISSSFSLIKFSILERIVLPETHLRTSGTSYFTCIYVCLSIYPFGNSVLDVAHVATTEAISSNYI